ncbi:hypothetical protein [Streptomyces coffeae]|uniref:Uncharacterized protein n=1 Tax=Streptomyces coffeae TaxID=621382 RepID=A0ABS1NML9_9ACTN|nr:hypothetical protein [Streptomyces coffeae]MBL1100991.1 hypothetical protein [Streptomyces coffeae]
MRVAAVVALASWTISPPIMVSVRLSGGTTAPRVKARPHLWMQRMMTNALPALRTWADQDKDSLRSITRADVLAVLADSGTPRVDMLQGLRHILRSLKNQRVIFTDPTIRIFCGMPSTTIPLPVEPDGLRRILHGQEAPSAARLGHLPRARLWATAQAKDHRPARWAAVSAEPHCSLAEPVRTRLAAYLDYRNRRWPHTANPYLFVSQTTGCGVEPVSSIWINDVLGMPTSRLREDSLLHKAKATGGDPRRICDLFGLSVGAALRYTGTIDQPSFKVLTGVIRAASP